MANRAIAFPFREFSLNSTHTEIEREKLIKMENETVSIDTVNKKERRKSRKSVHDVNQALGIVSGFSLVSLLS